MKIGGVYATSDAAVRQGCYTGDGLLGEVLEAAGELQALATQRSWYADSPQMVKAIEEAHRDYFKALKAIEEAV